MAEETMQERLDRVFENNPRDNINLLPQDTQDAIREQLCAIAERFATIHKTLGNGSDESLVRALYGAAGMAFFAGHNYAVEYGNLIAEMKEVRR